MELVKPNNTITGTIPKVVETPWHFSLNSQLYDKLTFRPYPMKFFTHNYGHFLLLNSSIERTAFKYSDDGRMVESLYNFEHNQQNIIQDKFNSNIYYAIRPYYLSGYENHIIEKVIYDKVTNEYTVLNSVIVSTILGHSKNQITLLYETDEELVFFCTARQSNGLHRPAIFTLNKNTFATVPFTTSDLYTCNITTTEDTVYVYRLSNTSVGNNDVNISKLNVANKQLTNIYRYSDIVVPATNRTICNTVKIGDNYYTLFTYVENANGKYYYRMMKIILDTDTDTCSTEFIDIDSNGFDLDKSDNLLYRNSIYHTMRVIEENGKTYVSLLIHAGANITTPAVYQQCLHILMRYENDTFTVVDTVDLSQGCFGSFEYGDSKHQIFYTPTSVEFYKFDSVREKMIHSFSKGGVFLQVGLDSLNRIITYGTDDRLEILTEGNSSNLRAYFEEELYDKGNENIESKVTFYAKNFLDAYIDVSVKLTLVGPVVFTENGTNELVISSSSQGPKSVPVTITGFGNIEIIITQNV